MIKLRVREVAVQRGFNMSQLSFRSETAMSSVRRYWYGTKDGLEKGDPFRSIDLDVLERIAKALGVSPLELFHDSDSPSEPPRMENSPPPESEPGEPEASIDLGEYRMFRNVGDVYLAGSDLTTPIAQVRYEVQYDPQLPGSMLGEVKQVLSGESDRNRLVSLMNVRFGPFRHAENPSREEWQNPLTLRLKDGRLWDFYLLYATGTRVRFIGTTYYGDRFRMFSADDRGLRKAD